MRKKHTLRIAIGLVCCACFLVSEAQNVGINANGAAPDPSAMLDIDVSAVTGTKTGLLIPRMTSVQRGAIPVPATGLLVYDTSTDEFWYFDGLAWIPFLSTLTGWSTTGNAGTVDGTNFIGTTDDIPFNFRVNNVEAGRIGNADENTLLGYLAGSGITSGTANVAMGHNALRSNTSGSFNVAIGRGALSMATGRVGITAVGDSALARSNGNWNSAFGRGALKNSTSGFSNTALGYNNLASSTTGYRNTSVGTDCLPLLTTGAMNVGMGYFTLLHLINGNYNTAVGAYAGMNMTSGTINSNMGTFSGQGITTGTRNTTIGAYAGQNLSTNHYNTLVGVAAGQGTTLGDANSCLGFQAGIQIGAGTNNTYLGYRAGYNAVGLDRSVAIGYNAQVTANNSMVLGGTGVDAVSVGIGVTAPTAELEVNGYTKLGIAAPAVQMLAIWSNTATSYGCRTIPHGLNASKILAVDIHVGVNSGSIGWVPPHHTWLPGYEYEYYYNTTDIVVCNSVTNSSLLYFKPIRILITYEE